MNATWTDACTIGGATGDATRSGAPLIFSTSDDPFETRTRLVVVEPNDGYRFIATQIISPPPSVSFDNMHTRGVNEAGFAYTWAYVIPATEPTDREAIGIPLYQFGRLLLSQAETVDDAIALVERYPRAYHGNFLFADSSGEIVLVEISTRSMHVETRTKSGAIARTNHWISPEMAPVGQPEDERRISSAHRYRRASDLVQAQMGQIDVDAAARIMSDHEGRASTGYSICAHGVETHWGGSVSSEIIEPRARRFHYCYGWPCGETPEHPERQSYQDRSWGVYLSFDLDDLKPGEYVTTNGRITPLGIRYLAGRSAPAPFPEPAAN